MHADDKTLQSRQWQNGFWLTVILVATVVLLIAAVWALISLGDWPVDEPPGEVHARPEPVRPAEPPPAEPVGMRLPLSQPSAP